jgi:hypothetical protein
MRYGRLGSGNEAVLGGVLVTVQPQGRSTIPLQIELKAGSSIASELAGDWILESRSLG